MPIPSVRPDPLRAPHRWIRDAAPWLAALVQTVVIAGCGSATVDENLAVPATTAVPVGSGTTATGTGSPAPGSGAATTTAVPEAVTSTSVGRDYPDPVAWGQDMLDVYGAVGEWKFTDASVEDWAMGTTLWVRTPYAFTEANQGAGPAMGLCVMFSDYADENDLDALVIDSVDGAWLIVASADGGTSSYGTDLADWACQAAS